MLKLYVWAGGEVRDMILFKPLIRQLLNRYELQIAWGCRKDHADLLADLDIERIPVGEQRDDPSEWENRRPSGYLPFPLEAKNSEKEEIPRWPALVREFNRRAEELKLPLFLPGNRTPLFHFQYREVTIRNDAVFIENGADRGGKNSEIIDMKFLSDCFRGLNFYCAQDPGFQAHNIFHGSHLDWVDLSSISNKCNAVIGTGGTAFLCALTETNRYKAKGWVREHPPSGPAWGDDLEEPIRYLASRDDLIRFLVEVEKAPKISLPNRNRRIAFEKRPFRSSRPAAG